jgi:GT2 family glycosyltransferase
MKLEDDTDERVIVGEIGTSNASSLLPIYEAQLAKQTEQLAELRERIVAYESEMRQLAELLSKTDRDLARKSSMLHWIVSSRSWKLTAWLRKLKLLGQTLQKPLGQSVDFVGDLESPVEGSRVSEFVSVSGWIYSPARPIVKVEAFIDSIPAGALEYGLPRPDVSAFSSQAPINCGYQGIFPIDESFTHRQKITVRVTDGGGNARDYRRTVLIDSQIKSSMMPALTLPHAQSNTVLFLRDDLSVAKKLQSTLGKISLESLLVSNSVLNFPQIANPEISIILVLHNRAELTLQCLYSILPNDTTSYEVVIVDNASTDETGQLLSRVNGAQIIRNEQNLHYLLACNQASNRARGQYLLLLNNDALLQAHSISSALATLKSSGDMGAVGGKIILPDGSLQEAGSIVWRDASCIGYGRGGSPLDPAFMFRRDVDYCSAVFLLTRRDLFLAHGGFDEAYVPAYYEETDYCTRLWESGKRVVYDPDVSVIHHEFASSTSRDTAIALQDKHREIFASRHKNWLERQVSPSGSIFDARVHQINRRTKILMLDDRVPHVSLGSGFPRSNRIVRELVTMGHLVTCYPLTYPREDWASVYQDIPREVEVMIDHGLPQLERFLKDRAGYYDVVLISRPHNMANLEPLIKAKPDLFKGARIIYDAEALFSLRQIELKRMKGEKLSAADRQHILDQEIKLAEHCDRVIAVTEQERSEFSRRGSKQVYTLGHALDVLPTANGFQERRNVLFVGAIHEPDSPNADAVLWFSQKILPRLQRILGTELDLIIAGLMHREVEDRLDKRFVQVKGAVKDLTELYDQCRIFIAPTRYSAGLPHKVHEAAAYGLPTVATTLIGSQLGWIDGQDLLLADDENGFAAACAKLYRDQELWSRLRKSALNRVAMECSPKSFSQQLKTIVE